MRRILISIGANLPAADGALPIESCRRAAVALDALPGLRLRGLSHWYRTAPVLRPGVLRPGVLRPGVLRPGVVRQGVLRQGVLRPGVSLADQPDYVNGVAHLAGAAEPADLLARLMALEAAAGRTRGLPDAPRVLDLDIIAMDDLVRDGPDPILPHPRAHLRAFVLVPLAEVAPDWEHPSLGCPVAGLIAKLTGQEIAPIG